MINLLTAPTASSVGEIAQRKKLQLRFKPWLEEKKIVFASRKKNKLHLIFRELFVVNRRKVRLINCERKGVKSLMKTLIKTEVESRNAKLHLRRCKVLRLTPLNCFNIVVLRTIFFLVNLQILSKAEVGWCGKYPNPLLRLS